MIYQCPSCRVVITNSRSDDLARIAFAAHLQLCALRVQMRIAGALEAIVENGLLMRMEGRVPTSASEQFQKDRAQSLYEAVHSEGGR